LHELVVNTTPRSSTILRPTFCDGGRCIVTGSATSKDLLVFDTRDGTAVSKGELDFKCCAVDCGALDAASAAAVNGALALLFPSIGGRPLLAAATGDACVQILQGVVKES
jgi:hypothetical protein